MCLKLSSSLLGRLGVTSAQERLQMLDEIRSNVVLELHPIPSVRAFGNAVQQFRFLPESYLAAVGAHWDPGLDLLVYLRMFIEEETEDALQ
jgi:hypothetical protein